MVQEGIQMNFENVDWERLKNPSPLFKVFEPTKEKLMVVAKELYNKPLNLSDEFRNYDIIWAIIAQYFYAGRFNIIYDIGDMKGLLGFIDIVPSFKATVMFKLFDKKLIRGSDFVREVRNLLQLIMEQFDLKRLNTSSPDENIVRLARIIGFKQEGKRLKDFMWDGDYYTDFLLGMRRK